MSETDQHSSEKDQEDQEQEQELKFYKSAVDWRRNLVLQMLSEGHNQSHISRVLKVHRSTISIDVQYLREEARKQMHEFITERLPMAVTKSCTALDSITSTAWDLARNTEDDRIRLQALTLIKETEKDKIDIVSNVNIVDQIVTEQQKQQQQYVAPAPIPTEEEENVIAAEYIRDEKYSDSKEEPTSATGAKAIPVDGEDN